MIFSAVKEKAVENNIKVYQPTKVRDGEFVEILKEYEPDVIVVVAFGQILSEDILNIPKYGCINVHGQFFRNTEEPLLSSGRLLTEKSLVELLQCIWLKVWTAAI